MDRGALFLDTFFKPDLIVSLPAGHPQGHGGDGRDRPLRGHRRHRARPCARAGAQPRWRFLNLPIIAFVDIARTMPPLVVVLIVYFGLPNVGLVLPSYAVLWLVLSLLLAAFAEEIFWAGILSVRQGQWEAARSTGLTYTQTLFHVVLPQAVRLDRAAADQPHHRHHQEHRARHRHRRAGNPQPGDHGGELSRSTRRR